MPERLHIKFVTVYQRNDGHIMVVKDPEGKGYWGDVDLYTEDDGSMRVDFIGGTGGLGNVVRLLTQLDPDVLLRLLDEASMRSLGRIHDELHQLYEEAARHPGQVLER